MPSGHTGGRRKALATWIGEAMHDLDKEGACSALVLIHKVGVSDTEIHTVKLRQTDLTRERADEIGRLFQAKADVYSQDLSGVQTFCVLAFYGGRTEPEARHPFVVHPQSDQLNGLMTESPDQRGMIQQVMRQSDGITGGLIKQVGVIFGASQVMIEMLIRENRELAAENRAATQAVQKVYLEKIQHDHDLAMKRLAFERNTALYEGAMKLAPSLVNQITGKEVFPQATEDTALIDAIAERITPQTLAGLASLPGIAEHPEVMGALASRFAKTLEKKAKVEAERASLRASTDRVAAKQLAEHGAKTLEEEGVIDATH